MVCLSYADVAQGAWEEAKLLRRKKEAATARGL
jgi:hypothetical protein